MKAFLKTFLLFVATFVVFGLGFYFYKNYDFPEYLHQKTPERTSTKTPPSPELVKIFSVGHDLSYANFQWISLVQYIGEHVGQGNTHHYAVKLLDHTSRISPKFSSAYEWALWVLPIPQNANLHYSDEQKADLEPSLQIAHRGIAELCNSEKIDKIFASAINTELWENNNLKNPCQSGMLPYLIAFYEGQLGGNSDVAKQFYKVAGMQDDAPSVSKVLSILASAPKDDYRTIAMNFSLNAMGSLDEEPFFCQQLAQENFALLQKNISAAEIIALNKAEKQLTEPKKNNTISTQTCFDMLERSIKYTYLAFIQEESQKFPEITKIEDLLPKIWLPEVPTVQTQENMSIRKTDELWTYYAK